jgi:hypothetical protein
MANEKAKVAAAPVVAAPVVAEPQSAKLTELRATYATLWATMIKQVAGSKEAMTASLDVFKTQKLVDAEIANIGKAAADAKLAEQRNARAKMADDLIAAVKAGNADNIAAARELVVNELLAKYSHSSPAKTGTGTGTKGATSGAIREILLAEIASGHTVTDAKKAAEAQGYSRGTTGAVATAMIKAGEITV